MSIHLEWDGDRRIGPVYLGMTFDECREAVPGVLDDRPAVDDPEILADLGPSYEWCSAEYGVMVGFRRDVATFISCDDHFWFRGTDLVGLPQPEAVALLGGQKQISNDWTTLLIVETELGPEVWSREGVVTCVSINCETDD